jgi:hypothetical protein
MSCEAPNVPINAHQSRRLSLTVMVALALLTQMSCSSVSTFNVPDDHLIVPDQRIGSIRLGMSDQELFRVGTPNRTWQFRDFTGYAFGDRNVFVTAHTHQVGLIYTFDSRDRTSTGVGVGSSFPDLFRSFGPPTNTIFGNDVCGVPGMVEREYFQGGNVETAFSKRGSSCEDRPTNRVQVLGIKARGVEFL